MRVEQAVDGAEEGSLDHTIPLCKNLRQEVLLAMNLAIRIAAAILSVPPDVLAPMVPMMAPPPRNTLELQLREEIDSALSGSCCSASSDATPLFVLSESETSFVNCKSGLPASEKDLFAVGGDEAAPSTYGEITMLGARQLFYHMGLSTPNRRTIHDGNSKLQFFDLGSGGGRLVLQSHLELPSVCRSVGIELSPTRHEIAMRRLNELVLGGTIERIRALAHKSWGWEIGGCSSAVLDLYEGDLFELDITKATHMYLSSLCFSESMLERVVDKIETEGFSLQIVASLRLLPLRKSGDNSEKKDERDKSRVVRLGENPLMEFIEMTWTRGDGCPVYFYSVKQR
eukprot:CCRYP_010658-RH/>CCRYP_010658-RH protein AED:0.40 eAED:0.41 QI:0/0.66/0.5/1/0.66/0.5/4/1904/341